MKSIGQSGRNIGNLSVMCQDCKKRYDLAKAVKQADLRRERNVRCPYCGNIKGTV